MLAVVTQIKINVLHKTSSFRINIYNDSAHGSYYCLRWNTLCSPKHDIHTLEHQEIDEKVR